MNPDVFFQCREGANEHSAEIPVKVQHYMDEINKLTGRNYKLFNYYGAEDAEEVIVIMCSGSETVRDTVDYLNAHGRKVGMVQVHLFRPGQSGPGRPMTFEEARPVIDNILRQPKAMERFDEYSQQLRSKAVIDIRL